MNPRAVFLDRDGVLNEVVIRSGTLHPPATVADLRVTPDAPAALARLKAAGFLLVCVTNQPDVARGTQRREVVEAINARLRAVLPLDDCRVCYHDNADHCACRKPAPGLLLDAATRYGIDLSASYLVGDRWRDTEAGRRAGCRSILIDHGYTEPWQGAAPDYTTPTLTGAVAWILGDQPS